jgi:hypothetical protein
MQQREHTLEVREQPLLEIHIMRLEHQAGALSQREPLEQDKQSPDAHRPGILIAAQGLIIEQGKARRRATEHVHLQPEQLLDRLIRHTWVEGDDLGKDVVGRGDPDAPV